MVAVALMAATIASPQAATVNAEWTTTLQAFVEHDARGKALLTVRATDGANSPLRALANALLAEWDIPRNREGLSRPRAIHIARIAPGPTVVTLEIFLLTVEVDESGQVRDARFSRPPSQTNLGNEVLSKVRSSLFRPAFKDGRFIPAEIDLKYSVHVK